MQRHALRTALTLYQDGTLDLRTAATRAGVPVESLERALARTGRTVELRETGSEREPERVSIGAD